MLTKYMVQRRLTVWGKFWAERESGTGFASVSTTGRGCEILKTGVYSSGTSHLFSHMSDSIFVPDHIAEIDGHMAGFSQKVQEWMVRKYIKQETSGGKPIRNMFTDRGEIALTGLLD